MSRYVVSPSAEEGRTLARTALMGFVRVQVYVLALLFLPAWTLRFWQAWVYWALTASVLLLHTLYLLRHDPALVRRRLEAGPQAERERSQKRIQAVAGTAVAVVFLVPGLDHRFGWSSVPAAVVWAADAVVLLATTIVFFVFEANSFAASTVQVEEGQPVVSTGPYAWVRHPMYSGTALGFLATPFALGSPWALVPAVVLCLTLVVRLLDEESYLTSHLPGYGDYCRRVPYRLIPYVW